MLKEKGDERGKAEWKKRLRLVSWCPSQSEREMVMAEARGSMGGRPSSPAAAAL